MFEDWAVTRDHSSEIAKGRAYLCKIIFGAWNNHQSLQADNGSDGDLFGRSVYINEKSWLLENPEMFLMKGQYMCLLHRGKHIRRIQK